MKIGFDGRYAEGDLVGVGKYIRSLVLALSRRGITCVLFYSGKPKVGIKGKKILSVILPTHNRYYFEQVLLPFALKKYKLDLYHATGNLGVPLFSPIPTILTVHDIIPLEIKDYFSYSPTPFLSKPSYNLRLRSSLFRAIKIVSVSKYTKDRLVKKLSISGNKIKVIYSGPTELAIPGKLPQKLLGKKYILNQGGIDIRKNLDRLIEAFANVNKKHGEIKLVITGENKRIRQQLVILIEKLNLQDSVIFTGYVDDKILSAIVRSALIICYPTLSEGFGFPILEGFGAGIPVISSNTSSIPEVAGKAALLINPNNINEISDAIEKVLTDNKYANEMVLKGKAQYNMFSWEKAANEYLDLYHHI